MNRNYNKIELGNLAALPISAIFEFTITIEQFEQLRYVRKKLRKQAKPVISTSL
jgi:hypothetical protein